MKKYRIVKVDKAHGDTVFRVEKKYKFLWFSWWYGISVHTVHGNFYVSFDTCEKAQEWIEKEKRGNVREVIYKC